MYLLRPFLLLVREPIGGFKELLIPQVTYISTVLFLSLFLGLAYAIEYLFFEAIPFVYAGIYGWSPGLTGLSFLGITAGVGIGFCFQMWYIRYRYSARWMKTGEQPPLEDWLYTMLYGSFAMPVGMFWFGWAAEAKT